MTQTYQPLFSNSFLLATWNAEYKSYLESGSDQALQARLKNWADKEFQKETKAEQSFVQLFFSEIWGYTLSGMGAQKDGYTCAPKLAVEKAGQKGGTGEADLALGMFGLEGQGIPSTPQVLCEFKDILSGLDSPQNRKGNSRSPVKQCADYLREARAKLFGNEPIQPTWGIVTDMNEFRLYWWTNMPVQYQRFVIKSVAKHDTVGLIDDGDEAQFQRFLFSKIFHPNMLLTKGGKPPLELLLQNQWVKEKELESKFYKEYRAFRENLFDALVQHNKHSEISKSKLVRLSQRILDRLIFILYCEDMGKALSFPPHLLRDILRHISNDTYYDPNGSNAWAKIKDIFRAMADGLNFAGHDINRFNGGLYSQDPILDSLLIPNSVFCAKGQHDNPSIAKSTLLYLSATYNFGVTGAGGERVINLYTLGRIFEQSITELEIKVAEAEGRPSIGKLSKRKRDGVYYTPEWVTRFVVEQTIGKRLDELKNEIGWNDSLEINETDVEKSRNKDGTYNKSSVVWKYIQGLLKYEEALSRLKIVDPACGSGAFLIQSLDFLLGEHKRIGDDYNRFNPDQARYLDIDGLTRDILSNNIYGVDINPESVEITRLALWLHTAIPNKPLSNLDRNIQCGNSLVGSDFYDRRKDLLTALNEDQRDRVNAFDWQTRFAEVFARKNSGFDCVVGNPPYVKLQHFVKVDPDSSEYLKSARNVDGTVLFESTQTGSYDLYLPFIEQGIRLLNDTGRMGYIAPSVWLRNKYGEGLQKMIHRGQHIDRWLDFISFQVFDEAITYTALQFYQRAPAGSIHFANAPKGGVNVSDWENSEWQIEYKELDPSRSWNLLPRAERELFAKLNKQFKNLEKYSDSIFQSPKTSADPLYHLEKLGPNLYRRFKESDDFPFAENEQISCVIEDDLVRPLISGEECKRYQEPATDVYMLFPYDMTAEPVRPYDAETLRTRFPNAWAYLSTHKDQLKSREKGRFDTAEWYQFSRPQNMNKLNQQKIFIAGTAPEIRGILDSGGGFVANSSRVYSILLKNKDDYLYMLGLLNSKLLTFLFSRLARPKSGGYFDIETQYLAPLPIPNATTAQKAQIELCSVKAQELATKRRNVLLLLGKRLAACEAVIRPVSFLWPHLHDVAYWKSKNPKALGGTELTAWAKDHFASLIEEQLVRLDGYLPAGVTLDAEFKDGELTLKANGRQVMDGIFLDDEDGEFIAAQWVYLSRITNITDSTKAKVVAEKLCTTYRTENPALQAQFLKLIDDLKNLEREIHAIEADLNQKIYALYKLTSAEIQMVEAG
jgi:hypothetical protein